MSGYLDKLIQRVNGQLPVIKPVVRSSYSAVPSINEGQQEIKETATLPANQFPLGAAVPPSFSGQSSTETPGNLPRRAVQGENRANTAHEMSQPAAPAGLVQRKVENSPTVSNSQPAGPKLPAQPSPQQAEVGRTGQPSLIKSEAPGSSLYREQYENANKKDVQFSPSVPGVNNEGTAIERQRSPGRQPVSEAVMTGPQASRPVLAENRPQPETEASQQIFRHDTNIISDIAAAGIESRPHNLVRNFGAQPVDDDAGLNLVRQPYRLEQGASRHNAETLSAPTSPRMNSPGVSPPTTHVTVNIGRIEIKAVTPSHPPTIQTQPASKAREPAVTLESYLKTRDEAKR